jgi:hypothetical protein
MQLERVVQVVAIDNQYLLARLAGFDLVSRPNYGPVRLYIDAQRFDLLYTGAGNIEGEAHVKLELPPDSNATVAEIAAAAEDGSELCLERDG